MRRGGDLAWRSHVVSEDPAARRRGDWTSPHDALLDQQAAEFDEAARRVFEPIRPGFTAGLANPYVL